MTTNDPRARALLACYQKATGRRDSGNGDARINGHYMLKEEETRIEWMERMKIR